MPTASTDMPAAPPPRPGAASTAAGRPAANPWFVDLRELGRRAGSMHEIERSLPAPADWRVEMIGVPEGAEVSMRLRLESVMEGVLVSGEVDVPLVGSCARCLEPVKDTIDLEPLVRDAVVLSLPLAPVCSDDCRGLCVDCGQRLADLPPDHAHEVVDPRWAGLAGRFAASPGTPGENNPEEN